MELFESFNQVIQHQEIIHKTQNIFLLFGIDLSPFGALELDIVFTVLVFHLIFFLSFLLTGNQEVLEIAKKRKEAYSRLMRRKGFGLIKRLFTFRRAT